MPSGLQLNGLDSVCGYLHYNAPVTDHDHYHGLACYDYANTCLHPRSSHCMDLESSATLD